MNAVAADEKTKDELLEEAREADIEGRSTMTKDELVDALSASDSQEDDRSLRPAVDSTGAKTAPVPPAFPTGPVNVAPTSRFGIIANRSASRLGAKKRAAKERRAAAREA